LLLLCQALLPSFLDHCVRANCHANTHAQTQSLLLCFRGREREGRIIHLPLLFVSARPGMVIGVIRTNNMAAAESTSELLIGRPLCPHNSILNLESRTEPRVKKKPKKVLRTAASLPTIFRNLAAIFESECDTSPHFTIPLPLACRFATATVRLFKIMHNLLIHDSHKASEVHKVHR
jgi:hypothetical protein